MKQSGGHVAVYSEPGLGTTFRVYLPRVDDEAASGAAEAAREPIPSGTETILLVEDEASPRDAIGQTLRDAGYGVIEAAGPADALLRMETQADPVHLLLTDVVMPGMNGRNLSRRLARDRPQIKVPYMSGYTDEAIDQHGVLEPGVAFLAKPLHGGRAGPEGARHSRRRGVGLRSWPTPALSAPSPGAARDDQEVHEQEAPETRFARYTG